MGSRGRKKPFLHSLSINHLNIVYSSFLQLRYFTNRLQLCYPLSISQIHVQRLLSGAGKQFWQTSEVMERKLPRKYEELNNTCYKPACQTTDWKQAWKQRSSCFWVSYRFNNYFFFNMIYCFDQNAESLILGRLLMFLQIWLHA